MRDDLHDVSHSACLETTEVDDLPSGLRSKVRRADAGKQLLPVCYVEIDMGILV